METDLLSTDLWDSMTLVATVALIDEVTGKSVDAEKIGACTTAGQVIQLALAS